MTFTDFGRTEKERQEVLLLAIVCLSIGIFAADVLMPFSFIIWILYLVPLLMTVWLRNHFAPFIAATVLVVALILSAFITSPVNGPGSELTNRIVFVVMLGIVALFVWEIRKNYLSMEQELDKRKESEAGLKELNRTLEIWVEDRTRELNTIHTKLQEDINERKKMSEALSLANRKVSLLSSITRHDILNKIYALLMEFDLAKDIVKDPSLKQLLEKYERITIAIQQQISFTKDYQDIGVQSPKWNLVARMIRTVAMQFELKGVRVDTDLRDLEIYADPLVEKVFYNLIDNALRHGQNLTRITFSYRQSGDLLVIVCEDNGGGISAADKKKLFIKGFGKNTGLGLFLIREILSITNIAITETGEPGKGARFEITIPKRGWRFGEAAHPEP